MKQEYNISGQLEEFSAADEQYQLLKNSLVSLEMLGQEHYAIEKLLREKGNEILRLLLQGYLNRRAKDEIQLKSVTGTDSVERTHCRQDCNRGSMTLFGDVTVSRKGYSQRNSTRIHPLDEKLNLPADSYSFGLRERVAKEVIRGSFDAAVLNISQTTGGKIPKRQVQNLAVDLAQDFERFYKKRAAANEPEKITDLLVMTTDGKGIVMRPESLREATQQASKKSREKLKGGRLRKGEKPYRKRMAAVAAVYSIEKQFRTAQTIMISPEQPEETAPRARAKCKRVWASIKRDTSTVVDEILQEALRRDPEKKRQWVMLVDGQPHQLKSIQTILAKYGCESSTTIILDFVHVLEYLWKSAYCFELEGSDEAEAWVVERAIRILEGKASDVAAGMRRSATLRGLKKAARKAVDTCAAYLLKYKQFLRYDHYLKEGFPIATGVIEGACRHLIKDRMDITGARWGLEGAEALLKLRSLNSSEDLDEYLEFHRAESKSRIYSFAHAHLSQPRAA